MLIQTTLCASGVMKDVRLRASPRMQDAQKSEAYPTLHKYDNFVGSLSRDGSTHQLYAPRPVLRRKSGACYTMRNAIAARGEAAEQPLGAAFHGWFRESSHGSHLTGMARRFFLLQGLVRTLLRDADRRDASRARS